MSGHLRKLRAAATRIVRIMVRPSPRTENLIRRMADRSQVTASITDASPVAATCCSQILFACTMITGASPRTYSAGSPTSLQCGGQYAGLKLNLYVPTTRSSTSFIPVAWHYRPGRSCSHGRQRPVRPQHLPCGPQHEVPVR